MQAKEIRTVYTYFLNHVQHTTEATAIATTAITTPMITGVLLKSSNEMGVGGLVVPIKLNNNMQALAKSSGFHLIKILNQT